MAHSHKWLAKAPAQPLNFMGDSGPPHIEVWNRGGRRFSCLDNFRHSH